MRVDGSAGYVGIGSNSPGRKLEIEQNAMYRDGLRIDNIGFC